MKAQPAAALDVQLIIDASVALKLVVREPDSDRARDILEREAQRLAPDWMMVEIAGALAGKIRFEGLESVLAQEALQAMPLFIDRFVPTAPLLPRALELSAQLDHALYDCLYVAVAEAEEGCVLTADLQFVQAMERGSMGNLVERFR